MIPTVEEEDRAKGIEPVQPDPLETADGSSPFAANSETDPSGRARRIRLSLTALAILSAGSALGVAFFLYLVNHFPLLLIALSPLGRHVVLITPLADPVAIVAVVASRRMLFYAASFHLGRDLGPPGIDWLEQRAARFGRWVRWIERLFNRASRTVVLVGTGPTIAALAGISGMRFSVFMPLAAAGLVVRMALYVAFAGLLREPIEWLLAKIDEIWIPGTIVLVAAVAIYQWRRVRTLRRRA
jgi:membrane protein DedA with SNARE-associated domain